MTPIEPQATLKQLTFAEGGEEGDCIRVDCATQVIIQGHEEAEIVMQLCVV
jgi:hypothetical protein